MGGYDYSPLYDAKLDFMATIFDLWYPKELKTIRSNNIFTVFSVGKITFPSNS